MALEEVFWWFQDFIDDDLENEVMNKSYFNIIPFCRLSECHSIPKIQGFVEDTIQGYSDRDFRGDFRINRATYERLVIELSPILEYEDRPDGKEGLSVRKQILVYLWYLANQDSMREVSRLFGISISTVFRCVRRVSQAFCDIRSRIIIWPYILMQNDISQSICDRWKIPNVIGFIDGTHIRLSHTPFQDISYINRKGYPSVVLQVIVDDKLLIRDCYVGWPGSTHDARVYRNSPIYLSLSTGQSVLGQECFLIGDAAYPLSSFMITPYRNTGRLTESQRYFNTVVSSARQTVERTIGHLKGRFRRLKDVFCYSIEDICKLVMSACVLHNLCIMCDDDVSEFLCNDPGEVNNYPTVYPNNENGTHKRDNLVQYLAQFM